MRAFELSFKYRHPLVILGDGYLGQMTGRVVLPRELVKPGIPEWAVWGDQMHRRSLVCSLFLNEADLEARNRYLNDKYERMQGEASADLFLCEDAEVVIVACNTPARMAKGAVQTLRCDGVRAGLFRPQTLWPFPIGALLPLLPRTRHIVVVEASPGQLEDELRLALSHAGVQRHPEIAAVQRYGGVLPQVDEIVEHVKALVEVHA